MATRRAREMDALAYVRSRFYPPLHAWYAVAAVRSVDAVNAGRPEERIAIPSHVEPVPTNAYQVRNGRLVVEAREVVRILRLDHMIEEGSR